jgi:adenylate cyclase
MLSPFEQNTTIGAALAGKAAGEKLNSQFEAEGLKPFFTRFGIHVGEAVVGNLGSMERMNYTALGNTVNLASRIEGMNKRFGTAILVSEEVHSRVAHRFQFRTADSVLAKGMTRKTVIFELIEAADEDILVDAPTPHRIGIAHCGPAVDPSGVRVK